MARMPLTPEQQRAVTITDRDVGVLAAAGSGKTTVLSAHYETLIRTAKEPLHRILVFTFTDKAAAEIKSRIEADLGRSTIWEEIGPHFWSEAWVSTIHHFASRLCRQNAALLGIVGDFTILENELSLSRFDALATEILVRQVNNASKDCPLLFSQYGFDRLHALLVELHRKKIPPAEIRHNPALAEIYTEIEQRFRREKRETGVLDFDDLEEYVILLLEKFPDVRSRYQMLFHHILVDEFQDLNATQGRLIELLWQPGKNKLFFVGDPKQAIYGFRGANVDVFYRFWEKLPTLGGERIVLSENWRAASELIAFTNTLFTPLFENAPIPYTPLVATQSMLQGSVRHSTLTATSADERRYEESQAIAKKLKELALQGLAWNQMAVLSRSSRFFAALAPVLEAEAIPYDTQKTRAFATEPFVLFLENCFLFLLDPSDELAKLGILHSDRFGLSLSEIWDPAQAQNARTLLERASTPRALAPTGLVPTARAPTALVPSERLERFRSLYEDSEGRPFFHNPYESFLYFRFLDYLASNEHRGEKSLREWRQWLSAMKRHSPLAPQKPLASGDTKVQLLTVHAAKGLEFEAVFLADLAARTLPRRDMMLWNPNPRGEEPRSAWQESSPGKGLKRDFFKTPSFQLLSEKHDQLEQEELKRLFYVAVTRAKRVLVLHTAPLSASKHKAQGSLLSRSSWNDWIHFAFV